MEKKKTEEIKKIPMVSMEIQSVYAKKCMEIYVWAMVILENTEMTPHLAEI